MKLAEVEIVFEPCDDSFLEPADIQKINLGTLSFGLSGSGDHIEKRYSTDEVYLEIRLDDQDTEERWTIRRLDADDITHLVLKIDDEWWSIRVPWDARSENTNLKQQGYYDVKDKLYKLLITESDANYRRFAELHDDSDDRKWVHFYKEN